MGEAGDAACTASASAGLGYRRREPERTLLHAIVRAHLKTFLAETEQRGDGAGLPGFVISEFERYLACGILAHGFARVRCSSCGNEMLVAFSCKGRGFCPSCTTRRMQGTATHLLDRVLPHVPMRQWVLSLPRWARFLLARDPRLITRALDVALRAIFSLQRRRARQAGARAPRTGAVTFVQRFGGALNLNVHFHCVIPDGVFVRDGEGTRGKAAKRAILKLPPLGQIASGDRLHVAARPFVESGEAAGHECVGRSDMGLALRAKVSLLLEVLKHLPDLGLARKEAVISLRRDGHDFQIVPERPQREEEIVP